MKTAFLFIVAFAGLVDSAAVEPLVFEGTEGAGKGKHIVFLAGDHEYRSEESLPALARLLAKHHGFKVTNEGYRRMIVNGIFWAIGLEEAITPDMNVVFVDSFQPNTFGNHTHVREIKPEMYTGFENPIPAHNNITKPVRTKAAGQRPAAKKPAAKKPAKNNHSKNEMIDRFVRTVCVGGNYLLNNGSMGNGRLDPEAIRLYGVIGDWLKVNGKSIYGTRRNPLPTRPEWGDCSVSKDGKSLYLHILQWPDSGTITVNDLPAAAGGSDRQAQGLS